MEPASRGNPQMYPVRNARRGSVGSVHRGDDNSNNGVANGYQPNFHRDNQHNDLLKTIYVSNITASMPDDALWEAFTQFGRVESLVRRDVNVDMNNNTEQQYAFIRFRNRQEARYAITSGEINFYGRKLVIRARDKPSYYKQNYVNEKPRDFEGFDKQRARQVPGRYEPRGNTPEVTLGYPMSPNNISNMQNPGAVPAAAPAETLSKVLTVANLPADMSPKELYELFAALGNVERSYIYQQADTLGRRFGEVTMGTFYFAQKASEGLNNYLVRGVPLDVSYKVTTPPIVTIAPDSQAQIGVARNYAWAEPQMQWPYQLYGGNSPALPGAHTGAPYVQQNPGIVLPYAIWNGQGNTGNPANPNYGYGNLPMQGIPPTQTMSFCVYPQHGNGGQYQRVHHMAPAHHYKAPQDYSNGEASAGLSPPLESGSRSVSGASSATLVANNHEGMVEKKDGSPLIVTSPTYSEAAEKLALHDEKGASVPHTSSSSQGTETVQHLNETSTGHLETGEPQQPTNLQSFDPTQPSFVPETPRPRDPSNLYIKNLDDMYITTTMDLKAAFGQFGQIASAFLATYPNGVSKGFGFVAFVNPADAVTAKEQLDGVILGRKRVFVTFAERKEERTQRLRELFDSKKRNASEHKEAPSPNDGIEEESGTQNANPEDLACSTPREMQPTSGQSDEEGTHESAHGSTGNNEVHQDIMGTTEGEVTVTTTVTTTKAWKGTQLHGIAEVEEEEAPSTKKFRQQRTQHFVQQSRATAGVGVATKETRPVSFSHSCTPPPNGKSASSYQIADTRQDESRGSPVPVQQRPRAATGQTQRHGQNPRTGHRPFYPPGRSDSSSPMPAVRRSDHSAQQGSMQGVPTGPRSQVQSSRTGSVSARELAAQTKKKRVGRRGGEATSSAEAHEESDQQQAQHRSSSESPATRGAKSVDSDCTDAAAAHLERLEVCSEP